MKFPIDRIPLCPILNFWDFGRIMAIGQCVRHKPYLYASGRISSVENLPFVCGNISSASKDVIKISKFYRCAFCE
jgi:hypothetical protein